jgi:V8-like Glu-specific endopeptidase
MLAAGCAAEPLPEGDTGAASSDIINPQRSAAAYTEAVKVQVNNAAGDFCSGVLVSPRVVLTAAHCVAFNPDDDGTGAHGTWTIEAPFAVGGTQIRTASSGEPYDPAFYTLSVLNYDSTDSALHDIGLIYLDSAMTGVTLPTWSNTQYPIGATHPAVSAVGRASVSAGAGLVLSSAVTLSATTLADGYPHDNKTSLVTTGGDSGGPLFLDGTHTLVGTETRFDPSAKNLDYWARLDTDVYAFIQWAISLHGGATKNPLVDFADQLAAVLCGRAAGCCASLQAGYLMSPTTCRQIFDALGYEASARGLMNANPANVTINATSRSSCLTAIGNTSLCTVTSAAIKTNITNCMAALTGNVALGGACTESVECAGNAVCELDVAGAGTCKALHASGASCEVAYKSGSVDSRYDLAQELCSKRNGGASGLYCDGYDFVAGAYKTESTWTCKAAGANGASCGTNPDCTSYVCAPVGAASALTCVASTPFVTTNVCNAFK